MTCILRIVVLAVALFPYTCHGGAHATAIDVETSRSGSGVGKIKTEEYMYAMEYEKVTNTLAKRELEGEPDGAGCNCAKDGILAISEALEEVLGKIPIIFLGLLEANKELIWDGDWEPKEEFKKGISTIKELARCAIDALHYIDCGSCDVEDDSYSSYGQVGSPRGDRHFAQSPYPGITYYECCCDVRFIKDLTISMMHAIARILNLNPGGSDFTAVAVQSLKEITKSTIDDFKRPYVPPSQRFFHGTLESGNITVAGDTAEPNESTVAVSCEETVLSDIDVELSIDHTFLGVPMTFNVEVTSPEGTSVFVVSDSSFTVTHAAFENVTLDDDAIVGLEESGDIPYSGTYKPDNALSAFNGENANGVWVVAFTGGCADTPEELALVITPCSVEG